MRRPFAHSDWECLSSFLPRKSPPIGESSEFEIGSFGVCTHEPAPIHKSMNKRSKHKTEPRDSFVNNEAAEDRFRLVVEASPSALLMVDEKGFITLVNTRAEKLFGYSRQELLGQRTEMLVPERYRTEHSTHRNNFMEGPTTRSLGVGRDLFGRRKDGGEVPIEIGLNPIKTEEGTFVLASIIDISERKRDEEQLHLQSTALECAANAIMITDVNGDIVWVNRAFSESTGYTSAEVMGRNPRFLKSGKQNREFYQGMWGTILAGNVWHNTIINRRRDGALNHEDLTITPIRDDSGTITHFIGIKQDISEKTRAQKALQASELRYRRLFESAKDGILILDADSGQIVDVNPFLAEMLGYAKEELVDKELWEIGVFKDVVASKAAFVELQSQGYIRYEDLPLKSHSGIVKQVEFVSNSYLVNGARVIQCNIRDITERKLAEEALRESNQHLEQTLAELQRKSNELRAMTQQLWQASKLATMGELAASVAHELNNPLATIALRTELLADQLSESPSKRESAQIILTEVERMALLVNNLLQFSRRSHRQISTIDVAEEISNSVNFIAYYLRNRSVSVKSDFGADVPSIQADRQQLRQLFLNLLTNAADAMPEGGTLIIRTATAKVGEAKAALIEFIDSGIGIPPQNLDQIWDSFFTTKPEGKGTGLGLAICRRIVEEHGGTIDIESQVGQGTSVRVAIPAANGNSTPNYE